jgi:tRNA isopentenyl-2-thiomethyl-A-37 hydroxylase MiaE
MLNAEWKNSAIVNQHSAIDIQHSLCHLRLLGGTIPLIRKYVTRFP